jgi:hypothetical protein
MVIRMWSVLAFAAVVGCGGRVLDGTCAAEDGGGGWSCETTPADATGVVTDIAPCLPSFDPHGSCPTSGNLSGPSAPLSGSSSGVGFTPVGGSDCFSCASNGLGTHWVCDAPHWKSAGVYTCQP